MIATLRRLYPQTIVGIKDSGCELQDSLALAARLHAGAHRCTSATSPTCPSSAGAAAPARSAASPISCRALVHRLVAQPDAPGTAHAISRACERLLALLGGYSLTPALKGIMAVVTGERAWLARAATAGRARDRRSSAALEREIRAFGIDPNSD